jgi:XisH protein/XisI protein
MAHERPCIPAKDIYHDDVHAALVKDGWTITDDPLRLRWGKRDYFVDLGAEQVIAAERLGRRIAVEIKSFAGHSVVDDMEKALGQYLIYRSIMRRRQPDRERFLAVPKSIAKLFDEPLAAVNSYADIVERVLDSYTRIPYAHGDLICETIFDRPRGRFILVTLGWDDDERVHHSLAHIDILDGKLWIQADNTEHGLAPSSCAPASRNPTSSSPSAPPKFANTPNTP